MLIEAHPNLIWVEVWSKYKEVYDAEIADIPAEINLDEAEDEDDDDQGAENAESVSDIPPSS